MEKQWTEYRCTPPCNKLLTKYIATDGHYAFEIKCSNSVCKNLNYFGSIITNNLVEFRCSGIDKKKSIKAGHDVVCNKLLARVFPGTQLQIKCPRCGALVETVTNPVNEDKNNA